MMAAQGDPLAIRIEKLKLNRRADVSSEDSGPSPRSDMIRSEVAAAFAFCLAGRRKRELRKTKLGSRWVVFPVSLIRRDHVREYVDNRLLC